MGQSIDEGMEGFTDWLHDWHNMPEDVECDICSDNIADDSPNAIEFGGGLFCCDTCFVQARETNELLKEEWDQWVSSLTDSSPE